MARRNTRQELIDAALSYVDAHGLDALTLRTLGTELALHHTALYRHFKSKEDLLDSVFRSLLTDALGSVSPAIADPRERLTALCLAVRGVFATHPALSAAIVQGAGMLDESVELQRMALSALRDMGVPEAALGRVYQAMESFVLGSALYDFANAPHHVAERSRRYEHIDDPAFRPYAGSLEATAAHTEESFLWGLDAIFDSGLRAK